MLFYYLKLGIPIKDEEFDKVYPVYIRNLSANKFTPVEVAVKASKFLVKNNKTKVLDIGSGVGKFCFVGAAVTNGKFTGIEQLGEYIKIAENCQSVYDITDVQFIQGDIRDIDFLNYDSFYFFNPFYENLIYTKGKPYTPELYFDYSSYVKEQLNFLPLGTRVVTYYGSCEEIPLTYDLLSSDYNNNLKFWIKTHEQKDLCIFEGNLIRSIVLRLKKNGFSNVNEQNIFYDEIYKAFFEQVLRSHLGRGALIDEIVLHLLSKIVS